MLIFQADERRDKFYPWSHVLEEWQAVLLVACSAGFWGGFMRFLFEGKPKRAGSVDTPLMGLAIGPALTVVSGMYSAMMMEGSLHFRPTAVAVLCFLAGIAWEQSWAFIEKMAKSKYGQK
jgi:hypothetical protein